MKCVNCKNLGKLVDEAGVPYDWCDKVRDNPDIHAERKCKHYITATNADRIRSMTDEELAEFILQITECGRCPTGEIPCTGDSCRRTLLDWLRQEAET